MTDEQLTHGQLTRVLVVADWCAASQVTLLTITSPNDYTVINVDETPEIVEQYAITKLPTLLYLINDKEQNRIVGAINLSNI